MGKQYPEGEQEHLELVLKSILTKIDSETKDPEVRRERR